MTADAAGHFVLLGLTPGPVQLWVQGKGTPDTFVTVTAPGTEVKLTMQAGSALTGGVVTAEGQPVAGARVQAHALQPASRLEAFKGSGYATTDAQGHFTLKDLPARTYTITATDLQHRDASAEVTVPSSAPLQIAFPKLMQISGKVINSSAVAFDKLEVGSLQRVPMTQPDGKSVEAIGGGGQKARVGADGSFTIEGLVPGHYDVYVHGMVEGKDACTEGVRAETGEAHVSLAFPPPPKAK